jgi:preprotein translocase subunit SecF
MTAVDTPTTVTPEAPKRGLWSRLYHGETTWDFVGRRKIGFIISGVILLLSLGSLVTRQLNLGIDFEGGVAWEVNANGLTTDIAEGVLNSNGIEARSAKIQTLSGPSGDRIRVQAGDQSADVQAKVRDELATAAGVAAADVSVTTVSPTWGDQITKKAIQALLVFFLLISLYISWRFEWKMAIAAIAAVVHDVAISVGIYSIFGFEVTPATVIAFLTILGFSLYDTIVVFDKVQENGQRMGSRAPYADIVNLSMNQVLMRSINTSLAAVLPVLSVLVVGSMIMGAIALQDFALALFVGLLTGAYSSIFIATPILAILKEREPKYRALAGRRSKVSDLSDEHRAETSASRRPSGQGAGAIGSVVKPVPSDPSAALTHPPRPRKKRRR